MAKMSFNWRGYSEWLCESVGFPNDGSYSKLAKFLLDDDFTWLIPLDENRAVDGIELRYLYARISGVNDASIVQKTEDTKACSVLEMLVALSRRIERDITGTPGDDHPERWFWEFMHNLGIDDQNNDAFDDNYITMVIDTWLMRRFRRNGLGSPFPLDEPFGDQRRKEIWVQMQSYLNEHLNQEE